MRLYIVYDDDDYPWGYCTEYDTHYWKSLGFRVVYWGNFWS